MRERTRWGMTMVVVANLLLHGCGGGGGGGNDRVAPVPLEGDAAVQASVGVLQSTIAVLVGLRTENSPLSSVSSTCAGGSVDATCKVENRLSIIRGTFDQCRILLVGGNVATADGGVTFSTNDQGTCVTGMVADTATVEIDSDDLQQVLTDASGNELSRSRASGTDRIVPGGVGCAGANVMEHYDATIESATNARLPGRLIVDGSDVLLETSDFQLDQSSSGVPCERAVVATGQVDVEDRANGVRFSETLSGVTMSFTEGNDAALVQIDGSFSNDCIGDVTVTTVEPLRLHNATDCPTGGIVRVTIAGRVSEIRFAASGAMTIDYDNDGAANLIASTCRDALFAQCTL